MRGESALRTRVISSVGVILVGVVSSMLGGAIFAAVVAALGVGVYYEISRITPLIGVGTNLRISGYLVVILCASLALLTRDSWGLACAIGVGLLLPGSLMFRSAPNAESFSALIATMAAGLYVGLPAYGAIALRGTVGDVDMSWSNDLGQFFTLTGESTALGMAWTMVAIAATWLGDTFAMLIGQSYGKSPLLPHVSPKKTVEGAIGSVLGSAIATVALMLLLGIPDVSVPLALVIGIVFAVVGVYGDLLESFIKRSAGVKDSGTLIPGHGGIFDRTDALMPTLLTAWVIASILH